MSPEKWRPFCPGRDALNVRWMDEWMIKRMNVDEWLNVVIRAVCAEWRLWWMTDGMLNEIMNCFELWNIMECNECYLYFIL